MCIKFLILFLCLDCIYGWDPTIDVNTTSGLVRGSTIEVPVVNQTVNQFLGIPFAQPPIGKLRFARPEPLKEPIKGVIDATNAKSSCMQEGFGQTSEDCLVLSIWSKYLNSTNTDLKPVMFWIYGGSFTSGSIFLPTYDGKVLATYDVVIVSTNYRLGAFGFLYGGDNSSPGNLGLYDQTLALKWVRENIRAFGGDPNQITIFGESAGSFSVSAHILSPLSRGLFSRAILESGAGLVYKKRSYLTKSEALVDAKNMAKHFNCSVKDSNWLDCLRTVDAKDILKYHNFTTMLLEETEFVPMDAQHAFKNHNYSTNIDVMAGVMENEGSLLAKMVYPKVVDIKTEQDFKNMVDIIFVPGLDSTNITKFYLTNVNTSSSAALVKAFYDFYGDVYITCPSYLFAKLFAENSPSSRVFFYEWTYAGKLLGPLMGCTKDMGVCHASDIEYVFGLNVLMKTKESNFSADVMKMWTNFAKYGQPISSTTVGKEWPRMIDSVKEIPQTKEINPNVPDHIFQDLFAKTCDGFWKNYFL